MDIVPPETRSRMMAGIKGRDTGPELFLRRGLHARGFRYRLHGRDLPGSPDLVFPARRAVVFVHGCFWHAHPCRFSKIPDSRRAFWSDKLVRNRERDSRDVRLLSAAGWKILVVWTCALRTRSLRAKTLDEAAAWLEGCEAGVGKRPQAEGAALVQGACDVRQIPASLTCAP